MPREDLELRHIAVFCIFRLKSWKIVENEADHTLRCNRPIIHTVSSLAIPLSAPSFSFQRKSYCPRRQTAHQVAQLLDGTEPIWNFGNEFVMYMQYDGITARLNIEDCVREQITGYRLCQIFGQFPAMSVRHTRHPAPCRGRMHRCYRFQFERFMPGWRCSARRICHPARRWRMRKYPRAHLPRTGRSQGCPFPAWRAEFRARHRQRRIQISP